MNAIVRAYAGSTSPETPRALIWKGNTYHVQSILKRWREADQLGFLVACKPGDSIFKLYFSPKQDQWQVEPGGLIIQQK